MASSPDQDSSLESEDQQRPKTRKPRPYVDLKKLERLMAMNPIMEQVCLYFDTTQEHIAELIKSNYGFTFTEFREKNQTVIKHILVQKALAMALEDKNTAMMIFCLKNMCKWSDNNNPQENKGTVVNLRYNLIDEPEIKDVTPDPAN